jgi:hypothetical protein
MAEQGSSIVGKRLVYSDLDIANWEDLVDTPPEFPTESHIQSGPSSTPKRKNKECSPMRRIRIILLRHMGILLEK